MTDHLRGVHERVSQLGRRERSLWLWRLGATCVGIAGVVGLYGLMVPVIGLDRPTGALLGALGTTLMAWFFAYAPFRRAWHRAGTARRQAELLEAQEPKLRGRLVTVVERPDGAVGKESPAVLELIAKRADVLIRPIPADVIHPAAPVKRTVRVSGLAWVGVIVGALLLPGGLTGAYAWWAGEASVPAAGPDTTEQAQAAAKVGDITLKYIYPAYMNLDPYEVVNSTGEVHAPPGTRVQVSMRSGEVVESASLVAYEQPPNEVSVDAGRNLTGGFTVGPEQGTYRIMTFFQGVTKSTRSFPIVPEPDLPPEVVLLAEDTVMEIAVNEMVSFRWSAEDDYGLERVDAVATGEGQPLVTRVKRALQPTRTLGGTVNLRPADLGMRPGFTYELAFVGWDNDAITGSKSGTSASVKVVVLDAQGNTRMTEEVRDTLIDLFVDVLAGHLEESYPPGSDGASYVRWSRTLHDRYEALEAFIDEHHGRRRRLGREWARVERALEAASDVVAFVQVGFAEGRSVPDETRVNVSQMREEMVVTTEEAILFLDLLRSSLAMREIKSTIDRMNDDALAFERGMMGENSDMASRLFEVQNLAASLERLSVNADNLRSGGLQSLISDRSLELRALVDELNKEVSEEDEEAIEGLTGRAVRMLQSFAQAVKDELARRAQQQEEQQGDAQSVVEQLKEIAKNQRGLAEALRERRLEELDGLDAQMKEAWKEVLDGLDELQPRLERYDSKLGEARQVFYDRRVAEAMVETAGEAKMAADARDLSGVEDYLYNAEQIWMQYQTRLDVVPQRGPGATTSRDRERIAQDIDAIQKQTERLRKMEREGNDAQREQFSSMEGPQKDLGSALAGATKEAEKLAQEMPIHPRGMMEALEVASERMEQASRELARNQGMAAEGAQRMAEQKIREAIDALSQAASESQQLSDAQQPQGEEGEGESGSGEEESEGRSEGEELDGLSMPEPDDFMTPEEYRDTLLRGMEGAVPEQYQSLKRRYYEELVRQ